MAIGNLSKGGAEAQCCILINGLLARGHRVGVIYFHEGLDPLLHPSVERLKVERGAKWCLQKVWTQIDRYIRDWAPDIVHAWLPEVISIPAAYLGRKYGAQVVSSHRISLKFSGSIKKVLRDWTGLTAHFFSKKIVANYDISQEPSLFRWLFRARSGEVVANGLDLAALAAISARVVDSKPVDETSIQLFYAGRIAPEKNIEFLLRLLRDGKRAGMKLKLHIAGAGPKHFEEEFRRSVGKQELSANIQFLGERSDWQAYAKKSTALLFPSKGEGSSNVVLEAMAVSIPVVAAPNDMTKKLFRQGENGFVLSCQDTSPWLSTIRKLHESDPLRQQVKCGGRDTVKTYSMDSMIGSYIKIYQNLMKPVP